MRWLVASSMILCAACSNGGAPDTLDDAGSDPGEAEPRFGSHAPCDASAQCADGEACGYLISNGCAAEGECISNYACTEHVPTWCGCDGKTHYAACPFFPGEFWAPIPVQAEGFCPSDDAGSYPCDGSPPGGACSASNSSCCGGSYCSLATLTCCLTAYMQCTSDDQCCGRRCTDESSGLKRCL